MNVVRCKIHQQQNVVTLLHSRRLVREYERCINDLNATATEYEEDFIAVLLKLEDHGYGIVKISLSSEVSLRDNFVMSFITRVKCLRCQVLTWGRNLSLFPWFSCSEYLHCPSKSFKPVIATWVNITRSSNRGHWELHKVLEVLEMDFFYVSTGKTVKQKKNKKTHKNPQ